MTSSRKTSRPIRRRSSRASSAAALALIFCAALAVASDASAQSCPAPLAGARRLVLVTGKNFDAAIGTARLFERASAQEPWKQAGAPEPVVLGRSGMAWGFGFHALAAPGEPVKREGDGRTPAGVYRIGVSFGFAASPRPGHIRIARGTVCVDDPASPAYNTITSRRIVGAKVHAEEMRETAGYRHGLVVDYPADGKARGGSCIFIHVKRATNAPTAGCVALPEPRLLAWQQFSEPGAVLVTLPEAALARLAGCLPAHDPAKWEPRRR